MFEVTGEDISNLNDVDLRTLVVKLCEAELRRVDLPVLSGNVRWISLLRRTLSPLKR